MKMQKIKSILILMMTALALAACGGNQAALTPTVSVADVQTMAVSTFAFGLTQTAQAMPTVAPINTPTPANTAVVFNSLSPLNASGIAETPAAVLGNPTASCYSLHFISDVTVPDNTQMKPGEKFTKTWLVENNGSCAWQSGFKWTVVGGDPMGGSTVTLSETVNPSAQYQISVPMIAPTTSGAVKGTWRMSDANGTAFGESPWVLIVVGSASGTASVTSTPTP
jgi:uncharacterized protein affecting Mg2+/Co2+ transport